MTRRFPVRSVILLVLGASIAGQTGPCGVPAGPVTSGNSVVGVWRATYNDPYVGPTTVDLVLGTDGNFSEEYTSSSSLTMISGPYTVDFPVPGAIRLTVYDYYPKEFCGPLGCTTIQPIAGETWYYNLVDDNHMTLTNYYCTDTSVAGCVLNHVRQ